MSPAGQLWGGLSPEEHEQVARLCPQRRFSKGSTIFAPGDAPDSLYVLLSGLVTLTHLSEGGQESIPLLPRRDPSADGSPQSPAEPA